jgi:hypothetical protein
LNEVHPPRSTIQAGHQLINIKKPTAVVFVDDEPLANWSHDCRYLLHDPDNGKLYQEVKAGFPPFLVDPPSTFKGFHTPVVLHNPLRRIWTPAPEKVKIRFPWLAPKGQRYAVLFSGASNNRHTNDLEFLYRQLVDQFYFDEDNITVLNYDGTVNYSGGPRPVAHWPGDGTPYRMPVHGKGTKEALEEAINSLKKKLKKDDLLIVHTNNHGGHNGKESYLCTYSGEIYTASEFAGKLHELPVFSELIVMMEQCHSGGFNDAIIEQSTANRTTFSAACTEGKNSIGEADFDPFARDWIAAFAGADPYGAALVSDPDYDNSGKISAREAFAYADDVHHSYDSPVYSAYGSDAGDQNLHQKWRYIFIHRDFIVAELSLLQDKIKEPVRYRKVMRTKVLPALVALDDKLARKPEAPQKAEEMLRNIIHSAM